MEMQPLPQRKTQGEPRPSVSTSRKTAPQESLETQEAHETQEMQEAFSLPSMSELAEEMISEPGLGPELALVAEKAFSFRNFGLDNEATAALSATLFWQSFIESPAFPAYLQRLGASPLALHTSQKIIVCHGELGKQRIDLMILDPGSSHNVMNSLSHVKVSPEDLSRGWSNFITPRYPALAPPPSAPPSSVGSADPPMETEDFLIALAQHMPTIAIEVSKENSFGMILLPQPQVQYTSAETIYPDQPGSAPARRYTPLPEILLPEIALGIADCQYGAPVASIGMFTTHREGHIGFTTALHATKRKSTMVFVDDILPCVVIEEIPVLDACFAVVLDYESEAFSNYVLSKASVATTSPLSKRTPSIGETGTFKGTSSSTKMTEVCGWDWELPHGVNPNSQLKVYTRPDTIPGDSGAALISDQSDAILGFASYRSINTMAYSAWMWAESVFMAFQIPWDQKSWERQERERVEKEREEEERRERARAENEREGSARSPGYVYAIEGK
jgi:hypothetical protein